MTRKIIHLFIRARKKALKLFDKVLASDRFAYYYLKFYGVETELGNVKIYGLPLISKHQNSRIILEKGVTLISTSRYNVAGINHPVILATLAEGAVIHLKGCGASGAAICSVQRIFVDEGAALGANVKVYDTDFHPVDPIQRSDQKNFSDAMSAPIEIGRNVWIGAGAFILKGVTIGEEAVIAAGSVVLRNVPQYTLVAGNPAKFIRTLNIAKR